MVDVSFFRELQLLEAAWDGFQLELPGFFACADLFSGVQGNSNNDILEYTTFVFNIISLRSSRVYER